MPNTRPAGNQLFSANSTRQQRLINLESTITPSRGPLFRQQSIQGIPDTRISKPFQLPNQAASFDTGKAQIINNQQPVTSYQQKLIQLQLMHNSNNVDYIRQNAGDDDNYTIYAGGESTINPYGYSSMRSNLKSAASEFSFIRPSPSSYVQSTLPHKPRAQKGPIVPGNNYPDGLNRQQAVRSSLILPKTSKPAFKQHHGMDVNNNNNNNEFNFGFAPQQQFLFNPTNGGEKMQHQHQQQEDYLMCPPMRDLPMKPGKKRANNNSNLDSSNGGGATPKSSSLTSTIACFFRRAFSRRSKRKGSKNRNKLANQSCSSSVGALGECYANMATPIVPSAFSTGSKSIDGRATSTTTTTTMANQTTVISQQKQSSSHRMIDMIEAFNNKTSANVLLDEPADFSGRQPKPQARMSALNKFGSPLHKSNSVSTTMGLSHLADRASLLYDNELLLQQPNLSVVGPEAAAARSPMMMRSGKVLSANLTPIMSSRPNNSTTLVLQEEQRQQNLFLSPRERGGARSENLMPRPSSIYGQPSMISSPMITASGRAEERALNNNFGLHRNSLHGQASFSSSRERASCNSNEQQQQLHKLRHLMTKTPLFASLDTTREVSEELCSPVNENHHQQQQQLLSNYGEQQQNCFLPQRPSRHQQLESSIIVSSSPGLELAPDHRLQKNHRQAIVNPILQSPTMNAIYDNHPALMTNGNQQNQQQDAQKQTPMAYSHYDNHNHLMSDQQHQSPLQANASRARMSSSSMMQFLPSSPMARDSNHTTSVSTPAKYQTPESRTDKGRPAAIVAPSANGNFVQQHAQLVNCSPTFNQYNWQQQQQQKQQDFPVASQAARSPMLARRGNGSQSHYQQSPLVGQQTRLLNNGVQATLVKQQYVGGVVSIAGAPGINLEPSLAASLLRGTNINAYESSEPALFDNQSDQPKTFLVSTRLSKSMAQKNQLNLDNEQDYDPSEQTNNYRRTQKDSSDLASDLSSKSGSKSASSSAGRKSLSRISSSNSNRQESNERENSLASSNSSLERNRKRKLLSKQQQQQHQQASGSTRNGRHHSTTHSRNGRESSSELPSDEVSSNAGSSFDKSGDEEQRNWITSKLVED